MGAEITMIYAKDFAEMRGIGIDALRARWNNAMANFPSEFPHSFSRNNHLTSAQIQILDSSKSRRGVSRNVAAPTVRKFRTVAPVTEKISATETRETREISAIGEGFKSVKRRQIALISLMIAPTLASVSNMYEVSAELTDTLGAVCLTVLLSTSAVGFTLSGAKHRLAIAVTVSTVLYEAFCNLVRIYGGLMQGQNGNPTKFLGLVTDILPTGSHASAVILGLITAGLISGVQYAAIFEMQKTHP